MCSRIFTLAQLTVSPDFNIEANLSKFLPTTINKIKHLMQQTDLKYLNLNPRYNNLKNGGHFFGTPCIEVSIYFGAVWM